MVTGSEENNVNHPTSIQSSGEAQLLEYGPRKMLDERRRRERGRDTSLIWNGTWVDDNVLHTEKDGMMEIERFFALQTGERKKSKMTYPTHPLRLLKEVRLAAVPTEVVLCHEEQTFLSIEWRSNEARGHELLSVVASSNEFTWCELPAYSSF